MHFKNLNNDLVRRVRYQRLNILSHFTQALDRSFPTISKNYKKKLIWKKDSCKSRIKSICLISGLERSSNISKLKVSRHFFRRKCANCTFPGIRKASW